VSPLAEGDTEGGDLWFLVRISAVATIGGFLFGFDSGVINGTVEGLRLAFDSDSVGTGFNVASMLLGCAAGAFFAGRLADAFGRRTLLQMAAVFFVVSALGSGLAGSSTVFVFYRILGGLAVGAASILAPAYISEVARAALRGRLSSLQQVAILTGLFVAFLSNFVLAGLAGSAESTFWLGFEAWRWMFWVEVIPALVFLLALLGIPESPRYLVLRGRREEARRVLARLDGEDAARTRVAGIEATLAADRRTSLADLLDPVSGRLRRIIWVGLGLACLQQLVGINVVFYYGAVLWESVGFSEADALRINVITGAVSVGACLVALATIDHIGRKPLLWVGSIGMTLTLAAMTAAFAGADVGPGGELALGEARGRAALIAANAYVFFFNISWGPVMWVLLGEMFPNQIRGSGLAVAGLVQWLSNFAITMSFPVLLAGVGLAGAYGFYTFGGLLSIFFVFAMVHETRGVELEDMQG
jgi:SP family sugar:H+ symporter-like MFS transporter